MPYFPEAFRLVEDLNDEAASRHFSAIRCALGATHLSHELFLKADKHGVLLYIGLAAARIRGRKQTATFNDRTFYSNAVSSLQKLKDIHSIACDKHPLSFKFFLLNKMQTKISSLQVRKMYLDTVRLFSYDPAAKKETLGARAKTRAQRVVCAVIKH